MSACSSCSSSSTPTTLQQAMAKLASDQADKASASTINADESAVKQFEKAPPPAGLGTTVDVLA